MKIHHWGVVLLGLFVALGFTQDYLIWTWSLAEERPAGTTKLIFFADGRPYIAELDLQISDRAGAEVVNTRTRGPWLVLDLPDGQYRATASRPNGAIGRAGFAVREGQRNQEVTLKLPDR